MANPVSPKRGEFWLVSLNPIKGHEQAGDSRPCLIISSNGLNDGRMEMVIVLPLTKTDRGFPSHIKIAAKESGLNFDSMVMCEQIRAVSKERLVNRIGSRAPGSVLMAVERALKILLDVK